MNSATLKKATLPLFGAALAVALVCQALGARNGSGALAALGFERPAQAAVAAPPSASTANERGERVVAEGRLATYPGRQVTVATDLPGTLIRLTVDEKDRVRKGQVIAELKSDDRRAELTAARSRVHEADADLRFAELDIARAERLLAERVGTQEAVDRSRRNREAAQARRETATAEVERLLAQLAKMRIVAPIDGTVIVRSAQPGEHVEPGTPLVTLADLSHTRIEAEVDEFDAGRVHLGAAVAVSAEGFDGQTWKGKVEEIPDAVVGRRLKPQDPGRPQDTRVLMVKVALAEPTPLKLGQRVEVSISPR